MFNSGFRGRRENDGQGSINPQAQYVQNKYPQPYISGWSISGIDDRALNPAGGQTVLVNGSGFATGVSATLGGSQIGSVTLVNPTQISFTSPANAGGSYTLIVYNSTGGAAILVPGLTYSSVPTWTTAAGSIGSYYETTAINSNVVATSDSALTYTLASGSLPPGATLYANGVITGTAPVNSGSTTYTFNITATDAELQDTTRTFTMTINVDVVTWVSPANGTTYTQQSNVAISNVSLSATDAAGYGIVYSANSLPTGLSLTGSVIYGTPTVGANTSTLLTATANTTGRTATNTINWVVQLGDSYWNLTTLALNSLPTTTPFQSDASLNNASITPVGDTKSSPYNPYQTGYYSNYFDGTGDYLSMPSNAAFNLSGIDWTIETWVYATVLNSINFIFQTDGSSSTGLCLGINSAGTPYVYAGGFYYGTVGAITVNNWYHVAWVRSSSTLKIYVNGVGSNSQAFSVATNYATPRIGQNSSAAENYTGYLSNFRVIKGIPLYTTTFTPSTAPLVTVAGTSLLTCQSQRLIDTSPYNFAITKNGDTTAVPANPFATQYDYGTTYYSTYFDGTSDWLTTTLTGQTLGSGDFTIEFWMFQQINETHIFTYGTSWGDATGVQMIYYSGSTNYAVNVGAAGNNYFGPILRDQWVHVAIVRSSGTVKVYFNGIASATTLSTTANLTATALNIGYANTGNWASYAGCISNFRMVSGTAIYTTNFVPPTSSLTAVAGTRILTCQNSTLIDNSTNAFAITSNGDARPVPQSPFYSAYYSGYFDGSGDYLSINYSTGSTISGDFTWETWAYDTGTTYGTLLGWRTGSTGWSGFVIQRNNSSNITVSINNSAATITQTSATYLSNQWNHVAVVRSGTTVTLYVNGTSAGTATLSGSFNPGSSYWIGSDPYNNVSAVQMKGYVSNQRFVNGTAIYTSAFTPPTSPLTAVANTGLLTCQSLYFIDNSTNVFAITANGDSKVATLAPFTQPSQYGATTAVATYGSGYFDGTGDYLTIPSSGALTIGTSSATVEFWIYPTSVSGYQRIVTSSIAGFAAGTFCIRFNNGTFIAGAVGGNYINSSTVPTINSWSHIVWVGASGTTQALYINGVSVGTSTTYNITEAIQYIGGYYNVGPAEYTYGYISNLRVVKGTALYTANFLPSPTPLTAVTNTQLLTLQYNGGSNDSQFRDGSNFQNLLTRNGNATQGTFSPFSATGWSGYFDGTGDYLNLAANAAFAFGTGDFTVECWVNYTNKTNSGIFQIGATLFPTVNGIGLGLDNGPNWMLYYGNGSQTAAVTGPTNGVWYHVAVVRSSSVTKVYVNGSSTISTADSANYTGSTLGIAGIYSTSYLMNGYISNFRVTKGQALYTTTFTPATSPLTTTSQSATAGNVSLLTLQSPSFIDNSANRFTITVAGDSKTQSFSPFGGVTTTQYYSGYFDGTGDYLTLPNNAAFTMGTGDFTMELWWYHTSVSSNGIFSTAQTAAGGGAYGVMMCGDTVYIGNSSAYTALAWTLPLNQWNHLAVTRSSGVIRTFVNGTQAGTTSTVYNMTGTTCVVASQYTNAFYSAAGYASNVRVIKGQALYTTTFTPATSPLTTTSQGATAANVSLLTCQSSTFIDNSTNAFAITVNGDAIPTTIAPFAATSTTLVSYTTSVNGGSAYFDGTGDYVLTASTPALGTSDWTAECWFYPTALAGYGQVMGMRMNVSSGPNQYVPIYIQYGTGTGTFLFLSSTTGASWNITSGSSFGTCTTGQWFHIAVCRSGSSIYGFLNGVKKFTVNISTNSYSSTNPWHVGGNSGGDNSIGYISNCRYVIGTAIYTSAFSPPTAPPVPTAATVVLLNSTNSSIIDYTGKNDLETVGDARLAPQNPYGGSYYSNYFDGTGDYLSLATNVAFDFSTGSFTVEAWVYPTSLATDWFVISATGSGGLFVGYATGFGFGWGRTAVAWDYRPGTLTTNTWQHVAVTRSGTSMYVFVNGTQAGTTQTLSTAYNLGATATTVGSQGANYYLNGYISNLRVVKGQALYTTNFTPATSPLTTTSQSATAANVSLLTCQSSTFKDNSTNAFTVTRNGDTAVNSINPFQNNGTYSMYFDGTGDYNYIPATANFQFGTGDFTIECWLYLNSVASNQIIYDNRNGANGAYPTIYMNTSSIRYYTNSADQITGATLTTGQWYYIAVCKASGSTRLFVNGTQSGSTFADSMNYLVAPLRIGADYVPSSYLNGYVTDLRVTKYARYTTTFTPPTSTFQTK